MLTDYFTAIPKICASGARAAETGPYPPELTPVLRLAGCRCRIYLHKEVSDSRKQAVETLGGRCRFSSSITAGCIRLHSTQPLPKGTIIERAGAIKAGKVNNHTALACGVLEA